MGNIVAITCPHCGGQVQRSNNEYFAKCPYCGIEIAFNEIKEEAQLGAYKERLDVLEQSENADTAKRLELQKWIRIRNIVFVIICFLIFAAFLLVGISRNLGIRTIAGIGGLCMFLACLGMMIGVIALAYNYPGYNALYKTNEKFGRLKMAFKLAAAGIGLMLCSAFIAYLVLRFTGVGL